MWRYLALAYNKFCLAWELQLTELQPQWSFMIVFLNADAELEADTSYYENVDQPEP